MNIVFFISLLFVLQLFYWLVGRRASINLNNQEDYFLAGKTVKFFPLMMTFLATQVGGGVILGSAEEAYKFGWPVLLFPMGTVLGLILLGSGLGRRLARFQVSTIAEIFEVVYRSTLLRKVASILSVISLFMILVAQIIGSHKFLISLGISSTPLFILFWAIVIIYTTQGGLKAVISTDVVQAALFSVVFLCCFGFVLYFDPTIGSLELPQLGDFSKVSSKLSGWLLLPLLFMLIEQDMGQRCFAGGSPRIVSKASFVAGIITMIICIIPVFFGALAKNLGLEIPSGGSVLMTAIEKTTNPWIASIVGCAVMAAVISTATSLINAISSNLSGDFKRPSIDQKNPLRMVRAITCAISISAIFFAFYFNNIVDLLIQSYELSVCCLFIPIFIALFKKKCNFLAALFSILFGGLSFVLFKIVPIPFPKEIVSVLLSLIGYYFGEGITHYQDRLLKKAS